ncbi:MAG: tetratricopeptide repeat protein [Anaerolineae bacterium]|nr:tetratricopeptide repeat protein [Anaerolineae bacterium]
MSMSIPNLKQLSLFLLLLALNACTLTPQAAREPFSLFWERAQPLLTEQRYTEAAAVFEEAALAHPDDAAPLLHIGQICLVQQRWLLAEDAFNRALARRPDNVPAMAGLAESLLQQGRLAEALNWWHKAIATDPEFPGVFTGLGQTYLGWLNFTAAQDAFLNQQAHQEDYKATWYLAALTAPRDLSRAIDYLQSISQAKASPTLLSQRDYLLKTLAPFGPKTPPAEVAKATGLALAHIEQWPLAIHALTIALAEPGSLTQKDQAQALAFLGYSNTQVGRPALDLFEQAHQIDPSSALPLYFKGLYLRQQDALDAAVASFEQAITLDPQNAALYAEVAQTEAQRGSLSTAEIWYAAAIDVAEDELSFQILLLQLYANRNYRMSEAGIPLAKRIIELDDSHAEVYEMLGRMQFLTGAIEEGEQSLREALKLDPGLISAHYHLARLLESKGQNFAAREEYQRVVDLDTTDTYRNRALKDLLRLGAKKE